MSYSIIPCIQNALYDLSCDIFIFYATYCICHCFIIEAFSDVYPIILREITWVLINHLYKFFSYSF